MKNNYTYPMIIDENEEGFLNLIFPDFDDATTCVKQGDSFIEAAQDFLALMILEREESGKECISPSEHVTVQSGQRLAYINVWMPYHRTKVKEVYVKKTLTIPLWLDLLAKENNINFSATLVQGLKETLGL